MLELRGLSKHFGGVKAVDELDITVREGEIYSVRAGKKLPQPKAGYIRKGGARGDSDDHSAPAGRGVPRLWNRERHFRISLCQPTEQNLLKTGPRDSIFIRFVMAGRLGVRARRQPS